MHQRLGIGARSIARTIGVRHRAGDDTLQIFHVQVARRMATGINPVLDDVGMGVDDHWLFPDGGQDAAAHRLAATSESYCFVSQRFAIRQPTVRAGLKTLSTS